jgi:hypothetical protein
MRRIMRPVLVLLAFVFLIEAWLWDRLEPVAARIVAVIPFARFKTVLADWIVALPPTGTLILLAMPAAAVLPLKMFALWLLARGAWSEAVGVFVFAKLGAIGTTAFVFDVGREKLLQLDWFRAFYDYVIWLRQWAHALVDPIARRIKYRLRILAPRRAPRAFRLLLRIRRRILLPRSFEQEALRKWKSLDRLQNSRPPINLCPPS